MSPPKRHAGQTGPHSPKFSEVYRIATVLLSLGEEARHLFLLHECAANQELHDAVTQLIHSIEASSEDGALEKDLTEITDSIKRELRKLAEE